MPPRTTTDRINGPALRTIRVRTGYSIVGFCDALRDLGVRVTADHISNVEAGRRGASPEVIDAASKVLACPKAAFLLMSDTAA